MRRVVVYGRRPVPGEVKTRLAAELGNATAARLYDELLRHALEVATSVDPEAILALASPAGDGWMPDPPVRTELQVEGDLGERMAETFRSRFAEACTEVVLIGSDCALLRAAHLRDAFKGLRSASVVLGPALDGGYWMVGQRAPGHDLFRDVPWSSTNTLEVTRQRLLELSVPWSETATLADVDTLEDLERFLVSEGEDPVFVSRLRRARIRERRGSSEVR
jgi:rSAM/selenodomain-associated transferase 1